MHGNSYLNSYAEKTIMWRISSTIRHATNFTKWVLLEILFGTLSRVTGDRASADEIYRFQMIWSDLTILVRSIRNSH